MAITLRHDVITKSAQIAELCALKKMVFWGAERPANPVYQGVYAVMGHPVQKRYRHGGTFFKSTDS